MLWIANLAEFFAKCQNINTFTTSVLSESSRKGPHHPLVKNIIRMYWTTAAATAGTSAVPASSLKMAPKLDFSVKTMLLFFVLFISPLLFNYHSVIAEEQNDDNEEFLSSDCSNVASFKGQKISKGKIVVSSILLKKTMTKKSLICAQAGGWIKKIIK